MMLGYGKMAKTVQIINKKQGSSILLTFILYVQPAFLNSKGNKCLCRKDGSMYFLLLLLWMIFNGRVTLEVFLFGVVICGWLYWFISKHMGYNYKDEIRFAKKIPLYLKYAVVLVWEIFKANVDVIKVILSPKMEIEPAIVTFHTDLESDAARVTLANSITLTPGTYTASLENGDYVVQALDKSKFGEGLDDSVFVKQLRKLEGRK